MNQRRTRSLRSAVGSAALFAALYWLFMATPIGRPLGERAEFIASDMLFFLRDEWNRLHGHRPEFPNVTVIGFDDTSYEKLNLNQVEVVPRRVIAKAINYAADAGAAAVVLDILFSGPSNDPEGDAMLAAALRRVPSVIGLSIDERSERITVESQPYPPLEAAAAHLARVKIPQDFGIMRRFALSQQIFDERIGRMREVQPLSLVAARIVEKSVQLPPPESLVNYSAGRYLRYVPLYKLAGEGNLLPPKIIAGDVLFFGYTRQIGGASGTLDELPTPFRFAVPKTPGVEIHATMAANLLMSNWIRRLPWMVELAVGCLICILGTAPILTRQPNLGARVFLLVIALWFAISFFSFTNYQFHFPGILVVTCVLPLIYLDNATLHFRLAKKREEAITRSFGYYLAPELVQQISAEPSNGRFTLRAHDAAILFTDIERFTSLCEKVSGDELTNILTTYFQEAANAVREELGVVITFTGDGMFAIWGAPVSVDHPQERAVRAALKIQSRIAELAAQGKIPELKTRIGIHYGKLFAGTIGGEGKLQYTAVGDAVNVASRFESACKQLGVSILVTEEIAKSLSDKYPVNDLGLIQVPGKEDKLRAYTLT